MNTLIQMVRELIELRFNDDKSSDMEDGNLVIYNQEDEEIEVILI